MNEQDKLTINIGISLYIIFVAYIYLVTNNPVAAIQLCIFIIISTVYSIIYTDTDESINKTMIVGNATFKLVLLCLVSIYLIYSFKGDKIIPLVAGHLFSMVILFFSIISFLSDCGRIYTVAKQL